MSPLDHSLMMVSGVLGNLRRRSLGLRDKGAQDTEQEGLATRKPSLGFLGGAKSVCLAGDNLRVLGGERGEPGIPVQVAFRFPLQRCAVSLGK